MRRALTFALRPALLLLAVNSLAASPKPQQVRELEYGEVLFEFYQGDYFDAITTLMVASHKNRLVIHKDESELLLGGLQLSYGMRDYAEQQFRGVLDINADEETRNRAWYYLTRIAYQRQDFDQALRALAKIDTVKDSETGTGLALLKASIQMQQGDNKGAATTLEQVKADRSVHPYIQINHGIALLRNGDLEAGQAVLEKLASAELDDSELLALRDQANLGMGYQLLRHGKGEYAERFLDRVRLQGPQSNAALLGAGWAHAQQGNYRQALTPWLELQERSGFDTYVQEAHLAVPYAFARLGETRHAVQYYESSLSYFSKEQDRLNQAMSAVESGRFLELLSEIDVKDAQGGWLHAPPALENVPTGRYLHGLLAEHPFQEGLKDYRDLGLLIEQLDAKHGDIQLFRDMVEARRLAYSERSPRIRAELDNRQAAELNKQWLALEDKLTGQEADPDPMTLASTDELQQWARLEDTLDTLKTLPEDSRYHEMAERARWLQGILYWQIQDDYPQRLWETRKNLAGTKTGLDSALDRHEQVEALLQGMRNGFDGYDQRIAALQQRIVQLRPRLLASREATAQQLRKLALAELEQRRQRLESYSYQARYALARSYDQLAHNDGDRQ